MQAETVSYFLVVDGVVTQKQPYWEEGFIEGPDDVIVGYLYANGTFTAPPIPEPDWLALNTAEVERLQRLSNAQVSALQGRYDTIKEAIDDDDALPSEVAEFPIVTARLKLWKDYRKAVGRVSIQPTWPAAPVWPVQPEPYTSETSAVTAPAV